MAQNCSDRPRHRPVAAARTWSRGVDWRPTARRAVVGLVAAGFVITGTSDTRALSVPGATGVAMVADVAPTDGATADATATASASAPATAPATATATAPATGSAVTDTSAVGGATAMSPTAPRSAEAGWRAEAAVAEFQTQVAALDATSGASVSVYALNLETGLAASYNPVTAFVTASIVKVDLVAALLLQAQDAGRELTAAERSWATAAITVSSNDAATSIYGTIGGAGGLTRTNARLGLTETTPRSSWGLTTTSAADQVRLLTALTSDDGPLTASSRAYLLGLMSDVSDAQDWGVTAAGDDDALVKNGWLPYSGDGYAWEVNSIGVATVDGERLLIAVLTRHGASEASGIALVEQLSRLAAAAVT